MDDRSHRGFAGFILGFLTGAVAIIAAKMILMRSRMTRPGMRAESWTLRAKAELLQRMADAEDMTEREFDTLVDLITLRYGQLEEVGRDKIATVAAQIKEQWQKLKKEAHETRGDLEDVSEEEF